MGLHIHRHSLQPSKKYYYVFGDSYGWSEEYSFKAPPIPGPNVTTRVIAFGGMYIHVHVRTKVYACIHMRLQLRNSPTI